MDNNNFNQNNKKDIADTSSSDLLIKSRTSTNTSSNQLVKNEEVRKSRSSKNKKKKSTKKRVSIFVGLGVLLTILSLTVIGYFYVKASTNKPLDESKIIEDVKDVTYQEVDGLTNVLLIGSDSRYSTDTPKSDSMIIATVDSNNKNVKLTSLYRDTVVNIPGHGKNRLNAAFEIGGKELLISTIKSTYNIKIDKYVIIDFSGFQTIIDKLGGIEVDVKDYQLAELNKYIGESGSGNDCPVTDTGLQLLNGKQALSYARIRKGVGDDFERTQRQREVLSKIAEKLVSTEPSKYFGIMNSLLEYVDTNIDPMEGLNLAYTIYKFPTLDIEQLSIPVRELCIDREVPDLGSVLIMNVAANVEILNDFIFSNKIPDSTTIADYINKDPKNTTADNTPVVTEVSKPKAPAVAPTKPTAPTTPTVKDPATITPQNPATEPIKPVPTPTAPVPAPTEPVSEPAPTPPATAPNTQAPNTPTAPNTQAPTKPVVPTTSNPTPITNN